MNVSRDLGYLRASGDSRCIPRIYILRNLVLGPGNNFVKISTTYQMADIFTKLLPGPRTKFLSMYILGMRRESPEALK